MATTIERVERAVAPVVQSSGLELVDVELQSRTLRVVVDRPGGVDLDTIGATTSAISRLLDDGDLMPGGRYELEVSSPGVERRLRRPDHFAAQVGKQVAVKTKPGVPGERRVEGLLVATDDSGFTLEGEGVEGGRRRIAYGEVEKANTIFDWRAALAGTSSPTARAAQRAASRKMDGQDHETDEEDGTETR